MYKFDREPAVAGYFYSSNKEQLIKEIESCFLSKIGPGELPKVSSNGPREILGIISPHAGYMYSGPVASHGYYHLAKDGLPNLIILIGPNHSGIGSSISVYPKGVWHLPLGDLAVDEEFTQSLHDIDPYIDLDTSAHLYEHSVEVQLPFLQYIYKKANKTFKIVPIVMMHQTWSGVEVLGAALTKALEKLDRKDYLIVSSTDFSHYLPAKVASEKDAYAIKRILALDPHGLIDDVYKHDLSMCGYGPVATLLYVANNLGGKESVLLKYANSGDVTGDYNNVVSYASFKVL